MKYSLAGYTVIEVMLFLAISSVLFIAAIGVFGGRRESTQFTQAMQDLQSQFRAYANQVSTSYNPDVGGLNCSVGPIIGGTVRPVFSGAVAASQECILLGKAVQVIPGHDTIYSYPVFGLKTVYNGAVNTKDFPDSPDKANPEPAIDSATPTPNWLGVEPYSLPGGFSVVKATQSTVPSAEQDLLLLYSSLQNNNTTGNEIDGFSQGITFTVAHIKSGTLKSCIEMISCATPNALNGIWKLCISDGTKMAELLVRATSTGIATSLNMDGCS